MALYKNLPHSRKKTEELPFYRPIDRVVDFLWENREKLFPYLVAVLVLLVVYGGYRLYGLRYESSASQMLEQGDLEGAVQKYPRANASQIARLKLGRKALEAKQYEEAIRWYQALADPHTNNSLYRVSAEQNLALAYLKKGDDQDRAIQLLEKTIQDPGNISPDYTRLLLAKGYEMKGSTDKAKELYKILSEGTSQPAIQKEAKERLAWFDSQEKK